MGSGESKKKQFEIDNQGFFEYAPVAASNIPDDLIDDPFLDDGFELFDFGNESFIDACAAAEIIMEDEIFDCTDSKGCNSLDGVNAKDDFSAGSDSNQKSQDACNLKSSRKSHGICNAKSPSSFFDETNQNINSALLDLLEIILPKDTKAPSNLPDGLQVINRQDDINSAIDKATAAIQNHPWYDNQDSKIPSKTSNSRAGFFDNPPDLNSDLYSYEDFEIFRDISSPSSGSKQKFFRQATQYAKSNVTVGQEVHFSAYFPQYSVMNKEQLNWYFYWRGNARKRIFISTDSSYVFLYFYELISLIGCESPKEALDQILFVWKEARYKNSLFDSYLVVWVRDFILYYGESLEYYEVLEDILGDLTGKYLYQECILYFVEGERKSGILHALDKLSDYPVTEGHFYKNGYASFLEDCICEVLLKFNEKHLAKEGQNFLFALCGKFMRESAFKPFASAIFYEQGKMNNERSQSLNSKVVYTLSSPVIGSTLIPGLNEIKKLRKFVTGLLRTVESHLRDLSGYRWSIKKGKLSKSNLLFVEKAVQAFYDEHLAEKKRKERKVFRVNDDLLLKLKADSQHIREHLISVQEMANKLCEDPSEDTSKGTSEVTSEDVSRITENLSECQHLRPRGSLSTPFTLFVAQLSPGQRDVLSLITRAVSLDELRQASLASNTFLNVIIEEINELALDNIGDCIIDSSCNVPEIYEDYLPDVLLALRI